MFARFRVCARANCDAFLHLAHIPLKVFLTRRWKLSSLYSLSSLKDCKLLKLFKSYWGGLLKLSSLKTTLSSLSSLTFSTSHKI